MAHRESGLERRAQLTRDRDRRGLCIFEIQRVWRLLDGGDGRNMIARHSEPFDRLRINSREASLLQRRRPRPRKGAPSE